MTLPEMTVGEKFQYIVAGEEPMTTIRSFMVDQIKVAFPHANILDEDEGSSILGFCLFVIGHEITFGNYRNEFFILFNGVEYYISINFGYARDQITQKIIELINGAVSPEFSYH